MQPKKILIVGGGIGGLSLMQFLKNTAHQVTLIEKASHLRAEGAGIMLGINATKLLAKLDLMEKVLAHGTALDAFCMTDSQGQLLAKSDSNQLLQLTGLPTVGIHRGDLQRILAHRLEQSQIKFDTHIHAIIIGTDKKEVVFSNGHSETYDLIIAADGIHSPTRRLCHVPSALRYSGYTCWRLVVNFTKDCGTSGYEMWGKGKRFGIVPIGQNTIYCFATCNATKNSKAFQHISINEFKSLFSEFDGLANQIISCIPDDQTIIHNDLYDQQELCMINNGVAFMGDAAHAATPNMGQGAGMAIEDAFVLYNALTHHYSMADALAEYQRKREPRVKIIRDKSFTLGKIAQWESAVAIKIRNRLLKTLPVNGLTQSQRKLLLDF